MGAARAAFGLAVTGDVEVAGLVAATGTAGRTVTLATAAEEALERECPAAEGVRAGGVGEVAVLTDHGPAGLVWRAPGYGTFRVSRDGREVRFAPDGEWERMLVAQVLPLAAVLQGLEVLHAGAVVLGGSVVALSGPSGAGKSTLVGTLVAQGAAFVADDVVALEPQGDRGLLAHPGVGVLRPRDAGEAARVPVAPVAGPLALGALVLLARDAGPGEARVETLDPGDPRPLLGATFVASLLGPERLARALDVGARLAAGAALLRLHIPDGTSPAQAVGALRRALDARRGG